MFLKIPMGVPSWDFKEILKVFFECANGGIFNTCKYNQLLQDRLCKLLNVNYCILTEFGRISLEIGLKALDLKKGDGIILPSYVCPSVLLPIVKLGYVPQFADIEKNLNISPESVKKTIKSNTKAVIIPHLYGFPASIRQIIKIARQNGIYVIDDAAQSFGAAVNGKYLGTFGDIGILSFGAFKILNATKGGALITNDSLIFNRIKKIKLRKMSEIDAFDKFLRSIIKFKYRKFFYTPIHFLKKGKNSIIKGFSFSSKKYLDFYDYPKEYLFMSNLDSLLVYLQVKKLNQILEKRKFLGKKLFEAVQKEMPEILIESQTNNNNIYQSFVIKLPSNQYSRSLVTKFLFNQGIEAHAGYYPLHFYFNGWRIPFTESIWSNIITLPINTEMDLKKISLIIHSLKSIFLSKIG